MDQMSVSVGIAVGCSVLGLLLLACLINHLCGKIKCKMPKCCKRKKPSVKDKVLQKVGVKKSKSKSKSPFSVSTIVDKK